MENREIKFRGLSVKGRIWQYGNYVFLRHDKHYILSFEDDWVAVDPETVGQYTSLKDKNGKEIYEGDILRDSVDYSTYKVIYEDHTFKIMNITTGYRIGITFVSHCKQVGNIYENDDLLQS